MNTLTEKPFTETDLLNALKYIYPNSLLVKDSSVVITIDINYSVKFSIWMKKSNVFEVIPAKAIWNRTFEMKAKALEIALQLKEFIENGNSVQNESIEIPPTCPSCKNPNSNKSIICEWCGNKII